MPSFGAVAMRSGGLSSRRSLNVRTPVPALTAKRRRSGEGIVPSARRSGYGSRAYGPPPATADGAEVVDVSAAAPDRDARERTGALGDLARKPARDAMQLTAAEVALEL